jgi:hypothetical protein
MYWCSEDWEIETQDNRGENSGVPPTGKDWEPFAVTQHDGLEEGFDDQRCVMVTTAFRITRIWWRRPKQR